MSWQGIVGHDDVVEQFRRRLAAGRVTGTFLFVGPAGIGKRTFALKLAQALFCQGGTSESLDPCGVCEDCRLSLAGNHPDLIRVSKPAEQNILPLALFIGSEERLHREGLIHDIGLKPYQGGRRVAIIDDADFLTDISANSLLKTLEEPPPKSVMILLGTSPDRQLQTIRSRSQVIRFQPLPSEELAPLILAQKLANDEAAAMRLAAASGGSLEAARRWAEPAWAEFRRLLFEALSTREWEGARIAKLLLAFADDAGKEAPARRERLRGAIGLTVEYFRQVARILVGGPTAEDPELQQAAEQTVRRQPLDAEVCAAVIERCLAAIDHIDRNVHPTTLCDSLGDDVERLLAPSIAR